MRGGGTKVGDLMCVHYSDSDHAFVDTDIIDFNMRLWGLRSKAKIL